MEFPKLIIKSRKLFGRKTNKLRLRRIIPGVIYGHGIKAQSITVSLYEFEKIYQQVGESGLIDLIIDRQKPIKALVRDVQNDPRTNEINHIDFYQVKSGEKITTEVTLKFINEAPVVKEKGGILVTNLESLEIKCLPVNLINELEVDLSNLKDFNDKIRIKDLIIPSTIEIINDLVEAVVLVKEPRAEEVKTVEETLEEEQSTEGENKEGKEDKPVSTKAIAGEGKEKDQKKPDLAGKGKE